MAYHGQASAALTDTAMSAYKYSTPAHFDCQRTLQSVHTRARLRPLLTYRRLRALVLDTDNHIGIGGDTLEHIVPRCVLKDITPAHKLELDAFTCVALPGAVNSSHGIRRIGSGAGEFAPPHILRGVYARSALYVASISPRALRVVDTNVMPIARALDWNAEYPEQAWERERSKTFAMAQGAYVLRDIRDAVCGGQGRDLRWRAARLEDAVLGSIAGDSDIVADLSEWEDRAHMLSGLRGVEDPDLLVTMSTRE